MTNESNDLKTLIDAAQNKFGDVMTAKNIGDYIHFGIRRAQPVFNDAPFMTIKGFVTEDGIPAFIWGHYDLTETRMNEILKGN